ncbi:MAG: SMC family ATPase [Anaerolineaceae bacterium]|nr:SMC family ATPase [Anaerolineaceae bacterium]MDD4042580.1 SMC family ATPase [Anaerolineaceae bacterium]MDD4577235.1 SMC family ATPase [Anaerolineaceae bacterium]
MIPIRLRLAGFTSYREPVEIDFTGFDLACISGSNGAGKSSLLDAITYALYGKARVQNEAIINTASKTAEVTLDFEYENQVYRVTRSNTRGKTTQVDFFIRQPGEETEGTSWKVLTERTMRETDAKIVKTLRLDYDSFVNASFFLQGKADSFATKNPSERKEILAAILGLDQWEVFRKAANDKNRQARAEAKILERDIASIQEELETEERHRHDRDLVERDLALLREKVTSHQAQLDTLRARAQLVANQAKQVEALKLQLDRSRQILQRKQQQEAEKQATLAGYQQKLDQAAQIESSYQSLLTSRKQLEGQDELSQQYWPLERQRSGLESQLQSHLQSLEREIRTLQAEEQDLQTALRASEQKRAKLKELTEKLTTFSDSADLQEVVERTKELTAQIEELEGQNGSLKAQMDELANRRKKVESAHGSVCPMCGQDLSPQHREEIITEINLLGKPLGDQHRANRAQSDQLKAEKVKLENQAAQLRQQEVQRMTLQRDQALLQQELDLLQEREELWKKGKAARLLQATKERDEGSFLPDLRKQLVGLNQQIAGLGYEQDAHNRLRQQIQAQAVAEKLWQDLQIAQNSSFMLQAEIESMRNELEHEQESLLELEARYQSESASLEQARSEAEDSREAEAELASLREEQDVLNRRLGEINQALATIQTQRERQAHLRKEMEQTNEMIRQYSKLETAFGKDGVPAMLIEQALPELEDQANLLLARLSDYSMSVTFNSQRDYKDAKRKDKMETLDIIVSDGSGARDYETYSGGEAFRINFAIRLALSRVLARRAGAKLQTLVIDEGFGNQDAQGRQRLIEAINTVRPDFQKILIITHLEELKDYFSNRIEVTKTSTGSKAEVILG